MFNFHIISIFGLSLACIVLSAQEMSLVQPTASKKVPTVINADNISIDISKNIAVFTGNVKSDDGTTTITCKKMIIFLEDKKVGDASALERKQVSRILCEGNVVIVTKAQDGSGKIIDSHDGK